MTLIRPKDKDSEWVVFYFPTQTYTAVLSPLQYRYALKPPPPSATKYNRNPRPPRHDRLALNKELVLADAFSRKLTCPYELVDDPERGPVIKFELQYAELIAVNLFYQRLKCEVPLPSPHDYLDYVQRQRYRNGVEKNVAAWADDNMPEMWPILYERGGIAYLRFNTQKQLTRFRLYFG